MESKGATMTTQQAAYLADLISAADIRYEPQLVKAQGAERCSKLTAALMSAARERATSGLTVEAASDLIDAIKSTSWTAVAKLVWGSEVKAMVSKAIK
jgi:hypothetical protein